MFNNKNKGHIEILKRTISTTAFLIALLFLSMPVSASGNNFSVTVPMQLPIYMDEVGGISVSSTTSIYNNSDAPISVKNINVNTFNGWNIVDFNADFSLFNSDLKYLGMIFNGDVLSSDGNVGLNSSLWNEIPTGESIPINYNAKLPNQTDVIINEAIAEVVFTIDWADIYIPNYYSVTFISGDNGIINQGSPYVVEDILEGTNISFPSVSPNMYYRFTGWKNEANNQLVTNAQPINENLTLVAEFERLSDEQVVGNIRFNITTGEVLGRSGSATIINIPASINIDGNIYPMYTIINSAFENNSITSFSIENGISLIGNRAFYGNEIGEVNIPNSVLTIGNEAFRYNKIHSNNGTITIDNYPGGVSVGTNVFANNHPSQNRDVSNLIQWLRIAPLSLNKELINTNEKTDNQTDMDNEDVNKDNNSDEISSKIDKDAKMTEDSEETEEIEEIEETKDTETAEEAGEDNTHGTIREAADEVVKPEETKEEGDQN